jgi:soluble lytic murein transglycosylase-like protein
VSPGLRLRLFGLLVVAGACVWLGTAVSRAGSEGNRVAAPLPSGLVEIGEPSCPLPRRFRPAFELAAHDTGLPLALLVSVARVESSLRERARSDAGARGLLQLMPATARELALDPNQPSSNVLAGAR